MTFPPKRTDDDWYDEMQARRREHTEAKADLREIASTIRKIASAVVIFAAFAGMCLIVWMVGR
jgi:hypothetical protein